MAFTIWPNLGNAVKECLVMVGAKPGQLWARDGGQDDRAETRDRGYTEAREEQILEEPSRRALIRAGQVHRAQANPAQCQQGGRVKSGRVKSGRHEPLLTCSCEHPRV